MATYRIGIGSFSLAESGGVGIGTDTAGLGNLRVEGTFKTTDLDTTTGIATFTRYAGFAVDNIGIASDIVLSGEHSTQGDIVVGLNSTFTVSTGATVTVGTVESVSIGTHFSPPTGGVEDRPEVPVEGTVRFNEGFNTLEFYNGVDWRQFTPFDSGGTRGFLSGGIIAPAAFSEITWFNATTQGETQYFGQLTDDACPDDSTGNSIRLVNAHGSKAGIVDIIDYVAMATEGDAVDFGNLVTARCRKPSISSSTRGIWAGGKTPSVVNIIDYVEIMTTGNAIDFGDLNATKMGPMAANSPTRGLIAGGYTSAHTKDIQQITISSKGNGTNFGDMSFTGGYGAACSNPTRALFAGGYDQSNSSKTDKICSVNIASAGNGVDFGELTFARAWLWGAATPTRGFFGGGIPTHNVIHYISMQSGGQMVDFGDMAKGAYQTGGITNAHGGLGGY